MAEYLNEDDQVEALKKWWHENGKAVIGGAILGLAIVGGWQGWTRYSEGRAEQASAYYDQFSSSAQANDAAAAKLQAERIFEEFGSSTYALMAALEMARIEYAEGQSDAAIARLRWAISSAKDASLVQLARLRLARLLLDANDLDGALELSSQATGEGFAAEFAALRGDVLRAQGDLENARSAYQDALDKGVANQNLVRMKLTEISGTSTAS